MVGANKFGCALGEGGDGDGGHEGAAWEVCDAAGNGCEHTGLSRLIFLQSRRREVVVKSEHFGRCNRGVDLVDCGCHLEGLTCCFAISSLC